MLSSLAESVAGVYIEPFAGSAALFFCVRPKISVLADLNGHLTNALRMVRDSPFDLHNRLMALGRDEATYYGIHHKFNSLDPEGVEAATLFVYLNRNCFNGIWRTNAKGEFNVPYGGKKLSNSPPLHLLATCSKSLVRTEILHQDFRVTLADIEAGSFIYADPPYFNETVRTFVEYGRRSFAKDDLSDLVALLVSADKRGAHIALTYDGATDLEGIPKCWRRIPFEVTRNVGGFRGNRKRATEVIYTNIESNAAKP